MKKVLFYLIFSFTLTVSASAQPGDPGSDPDIPIDGGVSLLAAAGLAYGAKKMVDKRRESKTD